MVKHDLETQNKSTPLYRIRHSMAHILAQAVKMLYPDASLGFGPPTEHGFFYDFDFGDHILHEKELKKIEKQMRRIINQNQTFTRVDTSDSSDAIQKMEENKEAYKKSQIENLKQKGVTSFSFYTNGPFTDLCEGPHVETTNELKKVAFKLDRIAGAYWLGSEKNKMLTRIYALCYENEDELKAFIERRKLAEERDHKKLGKELDLFTISDDVGKGLILWLPHGTIIRDEIEKYAVELEFQNGYERVWTPHITKKELFLRSKHLPAYEESMFPPMQVVEDGINKETFYLKPMNCPFHHTIYLSRPRSYRELPIRFAEYGTCYRFEQSGELSGLIRVRSMTMNDAHIYCQEETLNEEIKSIMGMYQTFYKTFGLHQYTYRLSLRSTEPEEKDKFQGEDSLWDHAETKLKAALDEMNIPYDIGVGGSRVLWS